MDPDFPEELLRVGLMCDVTMAEFTELKRNIDYVVSLVNEKPGKLDLFELTKQTRLKHNPNNPLGFKDARDAISEAELKGLIRAGLATGYVERSKFGDRPVYFPNKEYP